MTSTQRQNQSPPQTCPHLSEAFQPFDNPQLDNPYPFYQRARQEEPIFYSPVFDAYVVTRYDDVLTILKDPARFSSANSLQSMSHYPPEVIDVLRQGFPFVPLISSDGELHQRLRAPFVKGFAPEQLQAMEGSICAIANRLVNSFIQDGQADILAQFAYPLPLEVILTMYGVPLEKMAEIKQWSNDMTALFSFQLTSDRQLECARSFVALQHFVAGLIEERRVAPRNDFISEVQNSDLNLAEMVILLCEMIVAGHKTSANMIGNALKLLLERPERWQYLRADPSLIPMALEEVLRYDAPAPSMIRTTTQEVSLGEINLPKDARILLLYGSANRDEQQYSNADSFEIDRFKPKTVNHLAFSHGTHHCLGASLARREGRIALEVLAAKLPNLRLRPNQQLTHIPTMLNRGYANLYVEWDDV